MALLVGIAYDPAVAVTKSTAALLAMTALDITNLRATFTAPANGRVKILLNGTVHGAATYPQILLGVMNGATVLKKMAPNGYLNGTASATTFVGVEVEFTLSGLTPAASYSLDAAYGVEQFVAATGIKYGGPDNAVAGDAFGAFVFEVWDVT